MQNEKNKLFVSNLSFDVDSSQLEAMFSEIEGVNVIEAKIITDRESGRSRGFGFVTLETEEMAEKAITEMNGKVVNERPLTVNIAKPMEKRDNFNRGGGNRY
ncbi:MAG TPA: RNA-binding protein [bacterium]|nr:RNA-binding protein [bacterium]